MSGERSRLARELPGAERCATAQELADRTVTLDQGGRPSSQLGDFITVSREAGVGGEEIAQLVGKKLGWQVLAKELLEIGLEQTMLLHNSLDQELIKALQKHHHNLHTKSTVV